MVTELEPIERLSRDLAREARGLSPREARYLVDAYYAIQEDRLRAQGQVRAATASGESSELLVWLFGQMEHLEGQVRRALDQWTDGQPVGQWLKSIHGIGPVLAAGLIAHVDIEKAPAVSHIWRFAGLDPSVKWLGREGAASTLRDALVLADAEPDDYAMTPDELAEYDRIVSEATGRVQLTTAQIMAISKLTNRRFGNLLRLAKDKQGRITRASMTSALARRPYNLQLKVLCWKLGDSFMKHRASDKDFYGRLYEERKAIETERNERGDFAELAARELATRTFRDADTRAVYESGKLPLGRIELRARRWAVKMLLSHFHEVLYTTRYGTRPATPYALSADGAGHAHYIAPPNFDGEKIVLP